MEKRTADRTDKEFVWTAHPARERLGTASVTLLIISAISTSIYISFHSLTWSLIALLVLLFSLNRFFLPSRFVINHEGIHAFYPFKRKRYYWEDIRRFVRDRHGGYLSTRHHFSKLDAFRGMHILFGKQQEIVIGRIQDLIKKKNSNELV